MRKLWHRLFGHGWMPLAYAICKCGMWITYSADGKRVFKNSIYVGKDSANG